MRREVSSVAPFRVAVLPEEMHHLPAGRGYSVIARRRQDGVARDFHAWLGEVSEERKSKSKIRIKKMIKSKSKVKSYFCSRTDA
jgi:hypothetical protein